MDASNASRGRLSSAIISPLTPDNEFTGTTPSWARGEDSALQESDFICPRAFVARQRPEVGDCVVLCVDGTLFFERSVFVPRRTLVCACMHSVALDLNAGIRCVGVRVFSRIHGRAVRLFYKKWGYGSTTPPWPTQDFFYCEWVPDYRYHRITVFSHK